MKSAMAQYDSKLSRHAQHRTQMKTHAEIGAAILRKHRMLSGD
jgi:hypothetical protein